MLPIADSKHLPKNLKSIVNILQKVEKSPTFQDTSLHITHDPQGRIASRCVAASEAGPSTFASASWFENPRVVGSSTNHATRPWHLEALGDKWFVGCCVWYFLDGRYWVGNELMQNPELNVVLMKHRPLNFQGQLCDHQRGWLSIHRIPRISRFVHLPHPGPVDETSHQSIKPRVRSGEWKWRRHGFLKKNSEQVELPFHPSIHP